MNNFVDKIISLLSTVSGLTKTYSPNLKEKQQMIAAVQLLPTTDNTVNTLSNNLAYVTIPFAVLVEGNENDSDSLGLAYAVFNRLHNTVNETFTGGTIINIESFGTPQYVDITDKENILYNINFSAIVEFD